MIAPREAFEKIHGFPETTNFYMHLDSYGCIQLFAAGYNQAILVGPHAIFHADHPRTDRANRVNEISYEEHAYTLSQMCCYQKNYCFNSKNWGLIEYGLTLNN